MFLQLVSDELNLRWAWDKVRNASIPGDIWIDEVALAAFELDLEENLRELSSQLRTGRYQMAPLRPMAFPKSRDKDGTPRVRQYFSVAVQDQVAWVAVLNIVGPHVDSRMPTWSYGYRLYRNVWIDVKEDGTKSLRIGRYRHSQGHIYAPFRQGWPRFRRHVYLTIRAMASTDNSNVFEHEEDRQEFAYQSELSDEHRCRYIFDGFWASAPPGEIYWCSIDLERFYPSLRLDTIHHNLIESLPDSYRNEANTLLNSMLEFPVDSTGWSPEDLERIELAPDISRYDHVPTGLFVAGFLANSALLKVDQEINDLAQRSHVAHFRYVDDHILLCRDFEKLVDWVKNYQELLDRHNTGAKVSIEKTEPNALGACIAGSLSSTSEIRDKEHFVSARERCRLDPDFPTPLMTKTLALVSAIARTDFELLDSDELVALVDQLEHLLLADLPEDEIPTKTRLAFAASRLASLAEHFLGTCDPMEEAGKASKQVEVQPEFPRFAQSGRSASPPIESANKALTTSRRVFHLLRKVLRDRPDRTRLWTRAVLLLRETGVPGLRQIISDVNALRQNGQQLSSDYLLANTLCVTGSSLVASAEVAIDEDQPYWRRIAATDFIRDVAATHRHLVIPPDAHWYLSKSFQQYFFSMFCAHRILHEPLTDLADSIPRDAIQKGHDLLIDSESAHRYGLLWWAGRTALGGLGARAPKWLIDIAQLLIHDPLLDKFWRYFPYDATGLVIRRLASTHEMGTEDAVAWWIEALRNRSHSDHLPTHISNPALLSAMRAISAGDDSTISMYEWVNECDLLMQRDPSDPRVSEWTALEISRQIASFVPDSLPLERHVFSRRAADSIDPRHIHPSNFRIPRSWVSGPAVSWFDWRGIVTQSKVQIVEEPYRVSDKRFAPLVESLLRAEINPTRGLGLILYCLLKRTFEFPAAWNGLGQATVLRSLRTLLLTDVTCSTLTLGLLQSCLLPRSAENLTFQREMFVGIFLDEDMTHDPLPILNPGAFSRAAGTCQEELRRHQLSTLTEKSLI